MGGTNAGEGEGEASEPGRSTTGRTVGDVGTDERAVDEAIVLAGSFLAILAVGAAFNAVVTDGEELLPTQVVLAALVPPVLYLFAVGRIASFELPGVTVVARELPTSVVPPDDEAGLEGRSFAGPEWAAAPDETGQRDAVTVVVGRTYEPGTIGAAVADERVKYVVYADSGGRVRGMSDAAVARERSGFSELVSDGRILEDPAVFTRLVYEDDSAREALGKLQRAEAEFLPAVDDDDRLVGVVTRSDVLSRLLLSMDDGVA